MLKEQFISNINHNIGDVSGKGTETTQVVSADRINAI